MPRGSRLAFENSFCHVFNRGINKQAIFIQPADYEFFLSRVLNLKEKFDHSLYAMVLMPNHFHLSIQIRKIPLRKIMSSLETAYAMYFNHLYHHCGPVFQNRYKSILVENDQYFIELSRYIYLNPVRDNLSKDPLSYPYSTFGEALGKTPLKFLDQEIVRLVGETTGSQKDYEKFVYAGIKQDPSPLSQLFETEESVLGSDYFRTRALKKVTVR